MGKYAITLQPVEKDGTKGDAIETAAAVAWSKEYEAFPESSGEANLKSLCGMTGGQVFDKPQDVAGVDMSGERVDYDPRFLLASIALVAFLVELLARRYGRSLRSAWLRRRRNP